MNNDFDNAVQRQLDAAMPWVGLYIAAASVVCILATVVDAVNSFRQKKLWFPCKYSSLNAASLTLLAVAMKLPMDLNTVMIKSVTDAAAKFTSLSFMSTIVTNSMPSLGPMNDKELLANVVGLVILGITITGNVCIQFIELKRFLKPGTVSLYFMIPTFLMLFSLVRLVSLAVAVPTMKRDLKSMYEEKHYAVLKEEEGVDMDDDDERRHVMMKYWVMAESCSSQFVMARSVVCTASSIIYSSSYIILFFVSHVMMGTRTNAKVESSYGIYTKWIVAIQGIGIMCIGVGVAMLRWFRIVMFRCSTTSSNSFGKEFIVEDYWIQTLKDWRNSFAGLQIRPNRCMKFLHNLKWCVFTLCIGIQIFIVILSKMLVFFSVFIVRPFLKISNNGVGEFNTIQIPSLLSQDLPDCWTLPVVTLTSIAIALPNTALHKRKQLLSSVSEGLSFASIVEETLDTSAQLKKIREVARVTWVEALLYSKWLEIDLKRAFLNCKSAKEIIQELSDRAEGNVMEFKREVQENPMNLPVKVVAANSMYRICQTILVSTVIEQTCEEMLERLSVMIADILAACLTNLPYALTKMCHQSCSEKRERSVREAFLLLGKTEQVIEVVRQQQRPSLDRDKAPYIEEWQAFLQQDER